MLLLLACADPHGGKATDLTYERDVAPILDANCVGCHVSGGIAPFPLTTYDEVYAQRNSVAAAVSSGSMPPWPPDPDCADYTRDSSLSDADIATIVDWSQGEAVDGDAADRPAPPDDVAGLSRTDTTLQLAAPFTPTEEPDQYRCFVLDWSESGTTYVTGFRANPGDRGEVHHVIAYLVKPEDAEAYRAKDPGDGYDCFSGPGDEGDGKAAWLGGWVPGSPGEDYPEGTGIEVPAGSLVVMQIHYNMSSQAGAPDSTTLDFKLDSAVDNQALITKVLDPAWLAGGMEIPAGESGVTHEYTIENPLSGDIRIWSAGLHMHQLGKTASLMLNHDGADDECLLDIPSWDFHWQGSYFFQEPKIAGGEDTVTISCTWDNTTDADANWGEGTTDEMCLGMLYVTR